MWAIGRSMHGAQQCVWRGVWKPAEISGTQPGWRRDNNDGTSSKSDAKHHLTCQCQHAVKYVHWKNYWAEQRDVYRAISTSRVFQQYTATVAVYNDGLVKCIMVYYMHLRTVYPWLEHRFQSTELKFETSAVVSNLGKVVHSTLLQFTQLYEYLAIDSGDICVQIVIEH